MNQSKQHSNQKKLYFLRSFTKTTDNSCWHYKEMTKTNGTSPAVMVNETVVPTDKENQIFDQLLKVLAHFNLETKIRVSGGWVRDKLLGKECCDIDFALDNMSGKEFCEKFGSPQQDVYTRDLTINSLFYNIHTCSIEDFTGRGLNDLKSGKIVTSSPPKVTFLDNPLRVLRAIRFSTRFDFEMVEEVKVAASYNDVKSAILGKIKRERIGIEIDLMVTGNNPTKAMNYIYELGLFSVVFTPFANYKPLISKEDEKNCVGFMDLAWRQFHEGGNCSFTNKQMRSYVYASLFFPLRKTVYIDNKNKSVPIVSHIFRTSLKLGPRCGYGVIRLHNGVEKFLGLIPFILSGEDMHKVDWEPDMIEVPVKLKPRILLGLILREVRDLWRVTLMLSSIVMEGVEKRSEEVFIEVEKNILELGLEKVWEVKRLVNGKYIMRHLELETGSRVVKIWKWKLRQWQLAYPSGSVDEFVNWMTEQNAVTRVKT